MSAQPIPQLFTPEEYFALEEQAAVRHEYYRGELFALDAPAGKAGGTKAHNRLVQNCTFALRLALRGRECEVYSENVRLAVAPGVYYTYPDVAVSCDPNDDDPRTMQQATLVMEVLSKSTEAYDRGWKFEQHRQLASLQHYLLVTQDRMLVECFTRTAAGTWELTTYHQPTDLIPLAALNITLAVADVYERLHLSPLRLAE